MLAVSVSRLILVSVGVFKELGALVRCFLARQLRPNHGAAKTQGRAPETEAVKRRRHARKIKDRLG